MPETPAHQPAPPWTEDEADAGATRLIRWMLGLILASGALLLCAAWLGEQPLAHGGPHPRVPHMLRGGPAAERGGALLWLGGALGLCQIGFFGAAFALGVRRSEAQGGLGALRTPILWGLLAYAGVWGLLLAAYARYAEAVSAASAADLVATATWLGFPLPTALLLFGFWPVPLVFVAVYLRAFDRFVLSDDDLARFRARIAEQRRTGAAADES